MRVLAIGDTHLHVRDRRHATRMRALAQILSNAQTTKPALILWPGDLFDAESGIDERNLLREYVKSLASVAPVVAVRGNHDAHGDGDFIADLRAAHPIWFVTRPQVLVVDTHSGPVAVAACPYPEKSLLLAAGVPASEMAEAIHQALDAVFLGLGAELAAHDAAGLPTIFTGHMTVGGAELSVGQMLLGHDLAVSATHLSRLPPSTVKVLNHIHKPQTLHGAHYVGSVCACNYGEAERKRFLALVHRDGAWEVESVPLDVPPMYHVEGVATRDGFDWVVKKGPDGPVTEAPLSWAGADVRCRYRFASADAGLLDTTKAQILATFAEAAHLELEPVAIVEREIRAPQVVAATTLVDKLRAWSEAQGLPTSDGVIEKLAALEQADADALLASLQARLTRQQTPAVAA